MILHLNQKQLGKYISAIIHRINGEKIKDKRGSEKIKKYSQTFFILFLSFIISLLLSSFILQSAVPSFDDLTIQSKVVSYTNPGICYDPINDSVWVADWDNAQIIEYNKTTLNPTGNTLSVASSPQAFVYDSDCNTFMVLAYGDDPPGDDYEVYNYSRDGTELNNFTLTGDWTGISFGADMSTLYMTSGSSVYNYTRDGVELSHMSFSGYPGGVNTDGIAVRVYDGKEVSFFVSEATSTKIAEFYFNNASYTGFNFEPSDGGVEGLCFENYYTLYHANDDHGPGTINLWYKYTSSNISDPEADEIEFLSINGNTNGTTIYESKPTINWTVVADASQYHLEIDNNDDFSSPEINYTDINQYNYPSNCNINATRVSFTILDILPSYDTYYMRVRAYTK